MSPRALDRICFGLPASLHEVLAGTGSLDISAFDGFAADAHAVIEVYRDVVAHPPLGLTREQALRALVRIPSHRLTDLTRERLDERLLAAPRQDWPQGTGSAAAPETRAEVVDRTPAAKPAGPVSEEAVAPRPAVPSREPIRPEQWRSRRQDAPAALLRTERFDPGRDPSQQAPGRLHGRMTLIRMWIGRIQAYDGRWVRSLSLNLPVRLGQGFGPEQLDDFQNRMRELLDRHVNRGLTLPGSGDQVHFDLSFTLAPEHPEAIELSRTTGPAPSDQLHFRLHAVVPSATAEAAQRLRNVNDATVLHEVMHYAGLPDRAQDDNSLFRRLAGRADDRGVMARTDELPDVVVTEDDLRIFEEVADSGPVVRSHPLKPLAEFPGKAAYEVLPHVDERDDRWDVSQAPRSWSAELSAYIRNYGSRHDGIIGMTNIEPIPAPVVDGLHQHVMRTLGIQASAAEHDQVMTQLRDRLSAEELSVHMPYLRGSTGHRVMVQVAGREHSVDVRMALTSPTASQRYGATDLEEDPSARVERRALGIQESANGVSAGTVRTVSVPWSASFPVHAAALVKGIDAGLSLGLTHNELSLSTVVTNGVLSYGVLRGRELFRPVDFQSVWEVRTDGSASNAPTAWDKAEHGPVTIWFPEHLYTDSAEEPPRPADLDDLPVWGVEDVRDPARLLLGVRRKFATELAGMSETSAKDVQAFFSESALRGTIQMQRQGGVLSPTLLDGSGRAIGVFQLTTEVVPGKAVSGTKRKVILESHLQQITRVDSSAKVSSGLSLDGSAGPSLTSARQPVITGGALGKLGGKWQTSDSLASGGSAVMMHSVRSNRDQSLVPAQVRHTVTLIRARGGFVTHDFGPWENGMHLRVLNAKSARGEVPDPATTLRKLPAELEHLQSVGVSAAPFKVEGTEVLFDRAEKWLRREGFLPPATPTAWWPFSEARVQAQLANLRRFEQARSWAGLRSAVDNMVDGGQTLYFDQPGAAGGTRRVQLRLSASRDVSKPTRHVRHLPDIHLIGMSTFSVGGSQQHGYSYGWQAGVGGGPKLPVGTAGKPWTLGPSLDYTHSRQTGHTSTVGAGLSQDQFYRNSSVGGYDDQEQSVESFRIPARFALDVYEATSSDPTVRFAEPVAGDRTDAAEQGAAAHTVPGSITLLVPRRRTIEPTRPDEAALPAPRIRASDRNDERRLAMTDEAGSTVPGATRLPDDAIVDTMHASAALRDAFHQIITGTQPGASTQHGTLGAVRQTAAAWTPQPLATAANWFSRKLVGAAAHDQTTSAAEALHAVLSTANLTARAHQIFSGSYVVEGLTLPGLASDEEISIELQGYLHQPKHISTGGQYFETDLGAMDTASQHLSKSSGHQTAIALNAQQSAPRVVPGHAAGQGKPSALPGSSARYGQTRRTEQSDTLTSTTGVMRLPTESGTQYRMGADATILLTVRRGTRNVVGNTVNLGSAPPVTVAVDLPRGVQFMMSAAQLLDYERWFRNVDGLTPPQRPLADLPLPERFVHTRELGSASVLSVTQLSDAPDPVTGRLYEQRDRLRRVLTDLVEQEAPGATQPGHASYMPGVMARIADATSPSALRVLAGRGPAGVLRFHFRHVAYGRARLVEVALSAKPSQDAAGLRTVRGYNAGALGSGMEQMHLHAPANTTRSVTTTRQHNTTVTPNANYLRPAEDTRTDRTAPALSLSATRSQTARVSATDEQRFWFRTETAAQFVVLYNYIGEVRSELVTEWPPNVITGVPEEGIRAYASDGTSVSAWAQRMLNGRPVRTATVPVRLGLRFPAEETAKPAQEIDLLAPGVSTRHPAETPHATPGENRIADGLRLVPTGPTPVFHVNFHTELVQALHEVAPRLSSDWQQLSASSSAETVAVRFGELIQAGKISLDLPRSVSMTSSMPGAYPGEEPQEAPATLQIAVYNPRRITDAGGVTLDRLHIPATAAGSTTTAGNAAALNVQTAYDAGMSHTVGATVPLLAQQPISQSLSSGTMSHRREWFKLGPAVGGPLPLTGKEPGNRTYEATVDMVITVAGPEGVRHVTGSAVTRLLERDVLGFGVTDERTSRNVYDVRSMLADQPEQHLRNWATHPLADLPEALARRLDPADRQGVQLWLAPGAEGGAKLLGRALYAASRTAVTADRDVELVFRTEAGWQYWLFDRTGSLITADARVAGAYEKFAAEVGTITESAGKQREARAAEEKLLGERKSLAEQQTAIDDEFTAAQKEFDAAKEEFDKLAAAKRKLDDDAAEQGLTGAEAGKEETRGLSGELNSAQERLDAAERRHGPATRARDKHNERLAELDKNIGTSRDDQTRHGNQQTQAEGHLPGLAHDLVQFRQTAGEGLVSVPLSSLAAGPARWPGSTVPFVDPASQADTSAQEPTTPPERTARVTGTSTQDRELLHPARRPAEDLREEPGTHDPHTTRYLTSSMATAPPVSIRTAAATSKVGPQGGHTAFIGMANTDDSMVNGLRESLRTQITQLADEVVSQDALLDDVAAFKKELKRTVLSDSRVQVLNLKLAEYPVPGHVATVKPHQASASYADVVFDQWWDNRFLDADGGALFGQGRPIEEVTEPEAGVRTGPADGAPVSASREDVPLTAQEAALPEAEAHPRKDRHTAEAPPGPFVGTRAEAAEPARTGQGSAMAFLDAPRPVSLDVAGGPAATGAAREAPEETPSHGDRLSQLREDRTAGSAERSLAHSSLRSWGRVPEPGGAAKGLVRATGAGRVSEEPPVVEADAAGPAVPSELLVLHLDRILAALGAATDDAGAMATLGGDLAKHIAGHWGSRTPGVVTLVVDVQHVGAVSAAISHAANALQATIRVRLGGDGPEVNFCPSS
ncbi:hypothetical protein [Actinacidiphila sp. bgisy167]|uniref:hypothetical protein n=1 Tax=Actinacidiphila sp. bgisy167 TaxID=3413797 RepID=UPI003D71F5B1